MDQQPKKDQDIYEKIAAVLFTAFTSVFWFLSTQISKDVYFALRDIALPDIMEYSMNRIKSTVKTTAEQKQEFAHLTQAQKNKLKHEIESGNITEEDLASLYKEYKRLYKQIQSPEFQMLDYKDQKTINQNFNKASYVLTYFQRK